jgi:hypothetical protein
VAIIVSIQNTVTASAARLSCGGLFVVPIVRSDFFFFVRGANG